MKYTVSYWLFCILWICFLASIWPCPTAYLKWIRFFVWYAGIRVVKYLLFRRVPIDTRFENKETVIVTGASCGIGAQIASLLASKSGKVIWTARDVDKAQSVLNDLRWSYYYGPRGYVLYLDLASKVAIRKFVEEYRSRETRLNCIVLNAAYHGNRRLTVDGFEMNIGVNHLGHMYLVYLLIDMLKESAPSRVTVITSDLHRLVKRVKFDDLEYKQDYSPFGAYNHSKLLNILFVRELARRLKGTGVTVYAAHPGTPVQSELMRDSWIGFWALQQFLIRPLCYLFCRSKYEGALTPVYCACSKDVANESGKYYENCWEDRPSSVASDGETAARLWDVSCEMLDIPKNWA